MPPGSPGAFPGKTGTALLAVKKSLTEIPPTTQRFTLSNWNYYCSCSNTVTFWLIVF